jgi:hypothetical protein
LLHLGEITNFQGEKQMGAVFDSEKDCYVIRPSPGVVSKAPSSEGAAISEPAPHSVEYFENAAMQSLSFERAHAEDNLLFCKQAAPANTTFVPAISRSDNGHWMFVHNETLKFISHKERR